MSRHPRTMDAVPAETARVANACVPHGHPDSAARCCARPTVLRPGRRGPVCRAWAAGRRPESSSPRAALTVCGAPARSAGGRRGPQSHRGEIPARLGADRSRRGSHPPQRVSGAAGRSSGQPPLVCARAGAPAGPRGDPRPRAPAVGRHARARGHPCHQPFGAGRRGHARGAQRPGCRGARVVTRSHPVAVVGALWAALRACPPAREYRQATGLG